MENTTMNASYQWQGQWAVRPGAFADPEEFYRYVQTCYCTLDEAEQTPNTSSCQPNLKIVCVCCSARRMCPT